MFGNDYITNKETLLDFDEKESTTTIMLPSTSQGIDKDRPKLVNPNEELGSESGWVCCETRLMTLISHCR